MSDLRLVNGWCGSCEGKVEAIAVEYAYDDCNHYDGISEWECVQCGRREGRWSGRILKDGESEPPHGEKR